jgi:hypothetical protein
MKDKKTINKFIDTIQNDRHAYNVFKDEAEKSGMMWYSPLKNNQSNFQHQYFN